MSYSIEPSSADCYEGTTCLINKLDIHDEEKLSQMEGGITFAKASILEETPISETFDFEHYKAIHRFLFEDIYDWAGKVRTVNLSKKGTRFVNADEIESTAERCFGRLKSENYFQSQDFDEFVDNIVDFYCVTNMLHPFREGNGRTQKIFITQLIRFNGYSFDFGDIDNDDLMIATIQAANGVTDFLKQLFRENISDRSFDITMS